MLVLAKPPSRGEAMDLSCVVVMRQKLLKDDSDSAFKPMVSSM